MKLVKPQCCARLDETLRLDVLGEDHTINAAQDHGQPGQAKQVEVPVPAADAELVCRAAKALTNDDKPARRLRDAMKEGPPGKVALKFKDWLASLPDELALVT